MLSTYLVRANRTSLNEGARVLIELAHFEARHVNVRHLGGRTYVANTDY